ncbi:hypothetical protein niasHT_003393 [Heterodera trifolii]|uniref:MATH domain-containing protein n=1 Tax=Heterodera trifolii TaxID=157864 RepID=A0ABD2LP21_9BILA
MSFSSKSSDDEFTIIDQAQVETSAFSDDEFEHVKIPEMEQTHKENTENGNVPDNGHKMNMANPDILTDRMKLLLSTAKGADAHFVVGKCDQKEEVVQRCLMCIDKNADILIKSDEFLQIDQKLLCEILARDELQIREEITIWNATLRWADAKCRQNAIESSAENLRAVLGPALFKIRFSLFSKEEFSEKIVSSGVLKMEEVIGIYQFLCHPNFRGKSGGLLYPLQFPSHWRIWAFGTIVMDIEKVSEFVREVFGSERKSKTVHIKGFPWKIMAQIQMKIEYVEKVKESREKWRESSERWRESNAKLMENSEKMKQNARELKENGEKLKEKAQEVKENGEKLKEKAQEVKEKAQELKESSEKLKEKAQEVKEKAQELKESSEKLKEKAQEVKEKAQELKESSEKLKEKAQEVKEKTQELKESSEKLKEKAQEVKEKTQELKESSEKIKEKAQEVKEKAQELKESSEKLKEKAQEVKEKAQELKESSEKLKEKAQEVKEKTQELKESSEKLKEKAQEVKEKAQELKESSEKLKEKSQEVKEKTQELKENGEKLKENDEHNKERKEKWEELKKWREIAGGEKWLGFFLLYDAPKNDSNLGCVCSATLRIVSQNSEVRDFQHKFDDVTMKPSNCWGFSNFISFAQLMDPGKELYDKSGDKVKLAIDLVVKEAAKTEDKA